MRDSCQYTRGYWFPKNSTLDFVWLPWWPPFPPFIFLLRYRSCHFASAQSGSKLHQSVGAKCGKCSDKVGDILVESMQPKHEKRSRKSMKNFFCWLVVTFPMFALLLTKREVWNSERTLLLDSYLAESRFRSGCLHFGGANFSSCHHWTRLFISSIKPIEYHAPWFDKYRLQVREVAALDRAGPGGAEMIVMLQADVVLKGNPLPLEMVRAKNMEKLFGESAYGGVRYVLFCDMVWFFASYINLWPCIPSLSDIILIAGTGDCHSPEPFVI